jgi:hypothetical protein
VSKLNTYTHEFVGYWCTSARTKNYFGKKIDQFGKSNANKSHPFILETKYTAVAVAVRALVKIGNSENARNQKGKLT